jgi:hypothetical protein
MVTFTDVDTAGIVTVPLCFLKSFTAKVSAPKQTNEKMRMNFSDAPITLPHMLFVDLR